MSSVKVQSTVGPDGVLNIRVPLGMDKAGHDVVVTIELGISARARSLVSEGDWHQFVSETYGSCARFALERPEQGQLEEREAIE